MPSVGSSALSSPAVAESTLDVLAGGGWEVDDAMLGRRRIGRVRWQQSLGDTSEWIASTPLADLTAALHATGVPRIVAGVPMARAGVETSASAAAVAPNSSGAATLPAPNAAPRSLSERV